MSDSLTQLLTLTSGCIIVRLWGVHRSTTTIFPPSSTVRSRHTNFANVTLIIIESALLYTATVVFCVVLDLTRTNAYYGATDVVSYLCLFTLCSHRCGPYVACRPTDSRGRWHIFRSHHHTYLDGRINGADSGFRRAGATIVTGGGKTR